MGLFRTTIFLGVVALCAAQGQGGNRPPKDRPNRGRPNPSACDLTAESIPDAVKTLVAQVINGTQSAELLLKHVQDITSPCLRFLKEKFGEEAGACTIEGTAGAICTACKQDDGTCEAGRAKELLSALMPCLNQDNLCDFFTKMLKDHSDCIPVEVSGRLVDHAIEKTCTLSVSDIKPCTLLTASSDNLEDYLESLVNEQDPTNANILAFLTSLEPMYTRVVSCRKVRAIAKVLQEKNIFDFTSPGAVALAQSEHLLKLMPFLPEEVCEDIPKEIVNQLLESIKDNDFMCDGSMRGRERRERGQGSDRDTDMAVDAVRNFFKDKVDACALESMDDDAIREIVEQNDRDMQCVFKCGRALVKTLTEGDSPLINVTLSADREKLGKLAQCLNQDTLLEGAQPGKCRDFGADLVPEDGIGGKEIAKKCRPQKEPKDLTRDDVLSMGCTFLFSGRSQRRAIRKEVICEALDAPTNGLSQCLAEQEERPEDFDRDIANLCANGSLSEEFGMRLGKALIDAPCDALGNTPPAVREKLAGLVAQGLENKRSQNKRGQRSKANCAKVEDLPLDTITQSRAMADKISLRTFKGKAGGNKEDFRRMTGMADGAEPKFSKSQKLHGFNILKGDKKTEDLTLKDISELGETVQGMPARELRNIKKEMRREILEKLCSQGDWSTEQMYELGNALEGAYRDYSPENPMDEIDVETIPSLDDACLKGLAASGVRFMNLSQEACQSVCQRLGETEQLARVMAPRQRRNITASCVKCFDLSAGASLTQDHVEILGQLLPEVTAEVLDKIDGNVLKATGLIFSNLRCIPPNVTEAIQKKINDAVQTSDSAEDLENIGVWASGLPMDKLKALKDKLPIYATSEMLSMSEDDKYCHRKMSDEAKMKIKEDFGKRREALKNLFLEESANRRRRAVTAFTCIVLETLGDAVTNLTVEEINAIPDDEFIDCTQTLGDKEDWSMEQVQALLAKYKTANSLSDVCAVSSVELQTLGSLAYGFTKEDVKCLENLDMDAAGNLADLKNWTQTHKEAFAERYLEKHNHASAASLTSGDLTALGSFLCGLSVGNIDKIPAREFVLAVRTIREVECDYDRLKAFAKLAKHTDAYGAVSDWTSAEWNDAGVLIAGLEGSEIKSADIDEVQAWTELAVANMRTDELKMLTVAQLEAMSPDQAYYIDVDDDDFSEEQKAAIISARSKDGSDGSGGSGDGGDGNGNNNTSGGAMVRASVAGLLLGAMALLL